MLRFGLLCHFCARSSPEHPLLFGADPGLGHIQVKERYPTIGELSYPLFSERTFGLGRYFAILRLVSLRTPHPGT